MPHEIETRHLTIPRQARYALTGAEEGPREVWFGLHGYGQRAADFLRYLSPVDDGRRLLVAPEGLHRYYLDHEARTVGASWMTSEDRLTDIADYVGWLERLHLHLLGSGGRDGAGGAGDPDAADGAAAGGGPANGSGSVAEGLPGGPPDRIVALGFSQGVHTLCRWLAFGEARIDVAVLWGSHVPPDLDLEANAGALRRARLMLVTGEEDPYYGPGDLEAVSARLADHGISSASLTFQGGHRLDPELLRTIAG